LQTIIGAAWLEPLKGKQERAERKREREEEREDRENRLRRGIYNEIFSIAINLGGAIEAHYDACSRGSAALKSADKGKNVGRPSFRVYASLKDDPVSFYQLEDAISIDSIYDSLEHTYNRIETFRSTPFDTADKARAYCEMTIAVFKIALLNIDETLNQLKAIFQDLNNGQLLRDWADIRQKAADTLGALDESHFSPMT